jgi:hypothetical protein
MCERCESVNEARERFDRLVPRASARPRRTWVDYLPRFFWPQG